MSVQVHRRPGRKVFVIDGEPYMLKGAAARLGLKIKTLDKRVYRGTELTKPVQRQSRD